MLKIGRRPLLDMLIKYMADFGFRRFILCVGYKSNLIKNYYTENDSMRGLNIVFSYEKAPLGTGGAVKNAKRLIQGNPFIVLNGDSFRKFNPADLLKFHRRKNSLVTILLKKVSNGCEYGEVKIGKSCRILSFNEKNSKVKNCLINAGAYIFDKSVFSLMPAASEFSLEFDFFPRMAKKKIFGYIYRGYFIDIGTPDRYIKAKKYLLNYGRN
jgi:NDP-sugar pyrophosphorylase family protein